MEKSTPNTPKPLKTLKTIKTSKTKPSKTEQTPTSTRTRRKSPSGAVIGLIVALVIAIIGGITGGVVAYHRGEQAGRAAAESDLRSSITSLAHAIQSKSDLLAKLAYDFKDDLDADAIAAYIAVLGALIDASDNPAVTKILQDYRSAWEGFKNIYDSGDNAKIEEAFKQLRDTATSTATSLKTTLDQTITDALKSL